MVLGEFKIIFMLFNSFDFLILFPFIFLLYWIIPTKYTSIRKAFLILVSFLLYLNWKSWFALVLIGVIVVTYLFARWLQNADRQKGVVVGGVILAFLPLLFFKYYNFVNESVWGLLSNVGLRYELKGLNWAVPIGISFFSFQAVGYLLDVYHKRVEVEKNFWDYTLFVSFFPQVVSGPISKADELLPQIKSLPKFDYEKARSGMQWLLWGLFLKVVLADRVGLYVDLIFNNYEHYSGWNTILAAVLYSFQIYGDFAGYSFMAVGVAKLLGFDLINNFDRPYFAQSVTNFWRRWHISLTRWLTQQVYIPLGGSRCLKMRQYFNIMVTFLVSGIWHGANWTFIVWGVLHGFFQIVEKALDLGKSESKGLLGVLRVGVTFVLVTLAWVIFRSPSIDVAVEFIASMVDFNGFVADGMDVLRYSVIALTILLFWELLCEYKKDFILHLAYYKVIRWMVYLFIVVMIMLTGVFDGGQFIYANF